MRGSKVGRFFAAKIPAAAYRNRNEFALDKQIRCAVKVYANQSAHELAAF
jgi:hypothetical protein